MTETAGGVPAEASRAAPETGDGHAELVFGLVGPTGVDLAKVCEELDHQLRSVKYNVEIVHLSERFADYLDVAPVSSTDEYQRISALMDLGTRIRERTSLKDIAARLGIVEIRLRRATRTGSADKPAPRTAYILRSLKRPEEVELLRWVYGDAFTLISVYATRPQRVANLARLFGPSARDHGANPEALAVELIARDYEEEGKSAGQRVGRTFPLADFFVSAEPRAALSRELQRLIRLVLGDPYLSPTRDEQTMFFAQAAALRSLDLSRQVGAAIVTEEGELVSTGCNEVPKALGGLYWASDPKPFRDIERGTDSNVDVKRDMVEEALKKLRAAGWLGPELASRTDRELAHEALFGDRPFLRRSSLFDVIEFGRAVHAEMAAVTQAAKVGTPLKDTLLFCTTFPCHLCARHIVAAGIREVVFIEPYEKSRTREMYSDSISVEPDEPSPTRVNFRSFVGVAPRRYMHLFRLERERKTEDGKVFGDDASIAQPRIKMFTLASLMAEVFVTKDIPPATASPSPGAPS